MKLIIEVTGNDKWEMISLARTLIRDAQAKLIDTGDEIHLGNGISTDKGQGQLSFLEDENPG